MYKFIFINIHLEGRNNMIKPIKKLKTIYMGDLILDDDIRLKVKDFWVDFSKDKDPNEFYDGDICCVIDIDDVEPSIRFK